MKKILIIGAIIGSMLLTGCQRIETGEVGLRVGFDKTVKADELAAGSFNQTIVGDVLVFPVREIAMTLDDIHPQTAENSTIADMDLTVIYNINPTSVSDLYTTRSKSFHAVDGRGDVVLMYNYLQTIAKSAAYKAVAKQKALEANLKRGDIENDTTQFIHEALKDEKLDMALTISKVQVRNIQPAQSIIESANAVISAQNALNAKKVEVEIAQQESNRLKMLAGSQQSLEYMRTKALTDIAEGVKEGKVNSILIPVDFKGLVSVGK